MEKVKVFLGGTCVDSTWREELLPKLDKERVEAFNPVVPNWTEECQAIEDYHKENDDLCLYVITPEGVGFYSWVEVTDDSNKRPKRTILCVLLEANGKTFDKHTLKCAKKTIEMVKENGAIVLTSLDEVAAFLNSYQKQEKQVPTKKLS